MTNKPQIMVADVQKHVVASLLRTSFCFCSVDFHPACRGVQENPRSARKCCHSQAVFNKVS